MSRWLEAARRAQRSARSDTDKTDKTDRTEVSSVSSVSSVLSGGDKRKIPSKPAPDLDGYAMRVAVLEHEDGLDRHEAEAVAAREQGYADAFAYADAVVPDWRRAVETARPPIQDATSWEDLRQVAIDFLDGPVAACAARSGWTAQALFGVVPTDAGPCFPTGAVFRQPQEGPLFAFDSEVALYRHADGGWHPRYITEFDAMDAVPLWKTAGDDISQSYENINSRDGEEPAPTARL